MIRFSNILIAALLAVGLLSGCGTQEETQLPPIKAAQPPKPAATAPAPQAVPAAELAPLNAKHRNPFQSFIIVQRGIDSVKKIKGPLECCDVKQFQLLAVVVGSEDSYALVLAPDTKRYIVRPGDLMGAREGRIVEINSTGLIVREHKKNAAGKVLSSTDQVLKLPAKKKLAP